MRVLGYIPARLGSERVRSKNLRLLAGRPLIHYAIETVLKTNAVDKFYVNTESSEIAEVSSALGIDVYRRPAHLAANETKTDDIVIDFLEKNPCDAVVLVNPTAPRLQPATIDRLVEEFKSSGCDSLFSCNLLRKHSIFDGRPLNFDPNQKSPRTQDLVPVQYINFIICIFRASVARERYDASGCFLYKGDVRFVNMPDDESLDIDWDIDFRMMEAFLEANNRPAEYHPVLGHQL